MKFFNLFRRQKTRKNAIPQASVVSDGVSQELYDGGKYPGGFGSTKIFFNDYVTLRARSEQLYKENLYARGVINCLVTNEINTGLTPEVLPNELLLGVESGSLGDWSELVEDRWSIWDATPSLCDTTKQADFGKLQRLARREALVCGDVLVVMRLDRITGLPRMQLISATNVVSPLALDKLQAGNRVEYGVELNQFNQHVAYYVAQLNGNIVRIPTFGAKSKRRIAWLVYGSEKRVGDVRGEPILSLMLQSLKDVDRYRDATQRKATTNAILAMFMRKTQDKIGVKPITNGAVRKKSGEVVSIDGTTRKYNIANHIPGLVIEDLQVGEEPVAFGNQGVDTSFADFEAAIIHAISWSNEIPPEILQLAFSSNYSASQAAINEFKNYLNKMRSEFGSSFCKPIYQEWLLSEVLQQRIKAPGLLDAWRDPQKYDIFGSWVFSEWSGAIKPSTDTRKQAQGYELMVSAGWMTNDRAAKELTGTKFSRNIRTIKRENALKEDAGLEVVETADPLKTTRDDDTEEEETDD